VAARLRSDGIETRPVFYPVSELPPYRGSTADEFPVADRIARRGLSLPTWAGLTRDDVRTVCRAVRPYCRLGGSTD